MVYLIDKVQYRTDREVFRIFLILRMDSGYACCYAAAGTSRITAASLSAAFTHCSPVV